MRQHPDVISTRAALDERKRLRAEKLAGKRKETFRRLDAGDEPAQIKSGLGIGADLFRKWRTEWQAEKGGAA